MTITELSGTQTQQHLSSLCDLLTDTINGGASMSYLAPLERATAEQHWHDVAANVAAGKSILMAALVENELVGSVELSLAWQPNGQHRAEVQKLMVFSTYRRRGIASQLMQAVERAAVQHQRRLIVLDTEQGSGAEPFYRRMGYQEAGVIPHFARNNDGDLKGTVLFYKQLEKM